MRLRAEHGQAWFSVLAAVLGALLVGTQAAASTAALVPRVVLQAGHAGAVMAAAWISPTRFISLGEDRQLLFWDGENRRVIDRLAVPLPAPGPDETWDYRIANLVVSPDGRWAALSVATTNPNFGVVPPNTVIVDLTRHLVTGLAPLWPVGWLAGGGFLARGDGSIGLERIDAASGARAALGPSFGDGAFAAVSADGKWLATAVAEPASRALNVWRTQPLALVHRFELGVAPVKAIGFDRTADRAFALDATEVLRVYSLAGGALETRSLGALDGAPPAGFREYEAIDLDSGALVIGDWRPVAGQASDFACACEVRIVDFASGRARARADGEVVGRDRAGGIIVIAKRLFGGGDAGPMIGDAARLDPATGVLTALGGRLAAPIALSPDLTTFVARAPVVASSYALAGADADVMGAPTILVEAKVAAPELRARLAALHPVVPADSAVSTDGRSIAFIVPAGTGGDAPPGGTEVKLWTPGDRRLLAWTTVAETWGAVRWLDARRLMFHAPYEARSLILDSVSGWSRRLALGEATALAGGRLVGWRTPPGADEQSSAGGALVIEDRRSQRPLAQPPPLSPWGGVPSETSAPRLIAAAQDGTVFAAAFLAHRSGCQMCAGDTWGRIGLWDAGGRFLREVRRPPTAHPVGPGRNFDEVAGLGFSADGERLLAVVGDAVLAWNWRTGQVLPSTAVAAWGGLDLPPTHGDNPTERRGMLGGVAASWREGLQGAYHFLAGGALFDLYLTPRNHWLLVDPDGRYDTDVPPDSDVLRWVMPNRPDQSLAPQTFMRDYFEPDLAAKVLACRAAGDCATVLPPPRDFTGLNLVLPEVTITRVTAGRSPGLAEVEVEARAGFDPGAPAGRQNSGVHDLRLFRDDRLVGEWPSARPGAGADLAAWRRQSRLATPAGGAFHHLFEVPVARLAPNLEPAFTAYAFNEDRIKSETSAQAFLILRTPTPTPIARGFVIAVGVDAYREAPGHDLTFAAADAQSITRGFAGMRGRTVTTLALTAEVGRPPRADKALLKAALDILAGRDPDRARAILARAGVDAAGLTKATPDDAVILAFSGHGWADPTGAFYLFPSDARMGATATAPQTASLVSSGELADWLRAVDAGDMTLIIDACHSAASFQEGGFKPGPMGDPGLGQLAYDKGIRILAATQSDAVALESAALHGGLLTFALTHDGLAGRTDTPLSQLLNFALDDVLRLEARDASGHRLFSGAEGATPLLVSRAPAQPEAPVQAPVLFDFTGRPSAVVMIPAAAP